MYMHICINVLTSRNILSSVNTLIYMYIHIHIHINTLYVYINTNVVYKYSVVQYLSEGNAGTYMHTYIYIHIYIHVYM